MPALFIVLAIAVAIGGFWISYQLKLQRQREFAALAARLGLKYDPDDPFDIPALPFGLFSKGDGRACENVMWGTLNEVEVQAFDYWFKTTTYNGKTRQIHYERFSCAIVDLPFVAPYTTIEPESILTRIADVVGFHDIDFESKEFNDKMQVKSQDHRFASYLIDARMMEWLLEVRGWHFELSGNKLLCYEGKVGPAKYEEIIGAGIMFLSHVPRVVPDTYGKAAP